MPSQGEVAPGASTLLDLHRDEAHLALLAALGDEQKNGILAALFRFLDARIDIARMGDFLLARFGDDIAGFDPLLRRRAFGFDRRDDRALRYRRRCRTDWRASSSSGASVMPSVLMIAVVAGRRLGGDDLLAILEPADHRRRPRLPCPCA